MADISSFLSQFLGMIISLFRYFYTLLDSIGFGGFSLLDFTISIFLIAFVVPLLVVVIPGRAVGEIRRHERKMRDD